MTCGKILRDAEHAAADVGVAMVDADRAVANEDFAGADRGCFRLLQAKAIEPAIVPEHDCPHCSTTTRNAARSNSVTSSPAAAKYVHMPMERLYVQT